MLQSYSVIYFVGRRLCINIRRYAVNNNNDRIRIGIEIAVRRKVSASKDYKAKGNITHFGASCRRQD